MLPPAATSAQSTLALTVSAQAGTAENLEIPEGFAALLALGLASHDGSQPAATLAEGAAALRQAGKSGGNAGGKILPVLLPDGETDTNASAASGIISAKPDETGKEPASVNDIPAQPGQTVLALALPIPTLSASNLIADPASPPPSAAADQPSSAKAQSAAALSVTATSVQLAATPANILKQASRADTGIPAGNIVAAATPENASPYGRQRISQQVQIAGVTATIGNSHSLAGLTNPAQSLTTASPSTDAPQGTGPQPQRPSAPIQAAAISPLIAAGAQLSQPAAIAVRLSVAAPDAKDLIQPVKVETNAAALVPDEGPATDSRPAAQASLAIHAARQAPTPATAQPAPAPAQPAVSAPASSAGTVETNSADLAESDSAAPSIPASQTTAARRAAQRQAAASGIQTANLGAVRSTTEAASAATSATAAAASQAIAGIASNDQARSTAVDLQPVLALRDAQPATTGHVNAPAVTPIASAQQTSHDFAALVDRLVEARDAAMPQAVRAAIQHADFGQIGLNFRTDDARLTVSMTNSDPDFAPAVQAAAASQANNAADNGPASQRNDGQQGQQQSANSSSTNQPQAQSQGSARGNDRDGGQPGRQTGGSASTAHGEDETQANRRGGIYA